MKRKRILGRLLIAVLLAIVIVGAYYVFDTGSRVTTLHAEHGMLTTHDRQEGISALTQYTLTIATLLLVLFTVRVAVEARRGTQQAAHDSLLERLDARGPRVVVAYEGTQVSVRRGRHFLRPASVQTPTGAMKEKNYLALGGEPLDDVTLIVSNSFSIRAYGDSPAFAMASPDAPSVIEARDVSAINPYDERPHYLTHSEELNGEEIRMVANGNLGAIGSPKSLREIAVFVTDSTRTVEDCYTFPINWWPFSVQDGEVVVQIYNADTECPRIVSATRTYHLERARVGID